MAEGAADQDAAAQDAGRQSLPEIVAELVDDGRDWLNAEVSVLRAEARRRLIIAGIGIGLMTMAAALVSGMLVALLVGVMFALTPAVGSGWAIVIVVAAALVLAAISAQAGRLQLRKLTRGVKIGEGNPRTPDRN